MKRLIVHVIGIEWAELQEERLKDININSKRENADKIGIIHMRGLGKYPSP